jgi:uncharacterized protein with PIN domain
MVVDTSALVAIILNEDEALLFEDLVLRAPVAVMSTASIYAIAWQTDRL